MTDICKKLEAILEEEEGGDTWPSQGQVASAIRDALTAILVLFSRILARPQGVGDK